ncbi:MAG: hypothetical protein U0Y68_05815 [Blastocatellia bacterium]
MDADFGAGECRTCCWGFRRNIIWDTSTGQRTLPEVQIEVADGLRLIPGGSGVVELSNLSLDQHSRLIAELRAIEA